MDDHALANTIRQAIGQADTLTLDALPLFYPILDILDLRGIVNAVRPTKADVDLGMVALVLVLNRLMAPQPLYWVNRWLAQTALAEPTGTGGTQPPSDPGQRRQDGHTPGHQ